MSESLWARTLAEFRDATASAEPTPGGGSVAMVSATFGLGLVVMALEITAKKPQSGDAAAELAGLIGEARTLLAELSHHADEDVAAFQAFMSAFKLPKQTDEEKTARKQALQGALVKATQAPLAAARSCVAALDLATRFVTLSKVDVVSDVGAGAVLLAGAVSAVLLNVDINLPRVADPALKQQFASERADLNFQGAAKTATVLECVNHRITAGK